MELTHPHDILHNRICLAQHGSPSTLMLLGFCQKLKFLLHGLIHFESQFLNSSEEDTQAMVPPSNKPLLGPMLS